RVAAPGVPARSVHRDDRDVPVRQRAGVGSAPPRAVAFRNRRRVLLSDDAHRLAGPYGKRRVADRRLVERAALAGLWTLRRPDAAELQWFLLRGGTRRGRRANAARSRPVGDHDRPL